MATENNISQTFLKTGLRDLHLLLSYPMSFFFYRSLNLLHPQILTLASNERIALTPVMRLLFEISNLRTATPATVSRAGILYINPQDLGWNP